MSVIVASALAGPSAPIAAAIAMPGTSASGAKPAPETLVGKTILRSTIALASPPAVPVKPGAPPERVQWPQYKEHLRECADDDQRWVCEVCTRDDSDATNPIIICEGCFACMHQHCCGVTKVPSGDFLCQLCAAGTASWLPPKCLLCPNSGGAMKRARPAAGHTGSDEWVHLSCALWLPGVEIHDRVYWEDICGISSLPENAGKLIPLRDRVAEAEAEQNASEEGRLQCLVCCGSGGMLLRCGAHGCSSFMHVSCAQRNGFHFQLTGPRFASPPHDQASSNALTPAVTGDATKNGESLLLQVFCSCAHPRDNRAFVPRAGKGLGNNSQPTGGGVLSAVDAKTVRMERLRRCRAAYLDAEDAVWQARAHHVLRPFPSDWDATAVEDAVVRAEALFTARHILASPKGAALRHSAFRHDLELFHLAFSAAPLEALIAQLDGLAVRPGGPTIDLHKLYRLVGDAVARVGPGARDYTVLLTADHSDTWMTIARLCTPATAVASGGAGTIAVVPSSSSSSWSSSSEAVTADERDAGSPGGVMDTDSTRTRLLAIYRRLLFPFASFFAPCGGWRLFVSPVFRLLLLSQPPLLRSGLNGGVCPDPDARLAGAILPRTSGVLIVRAPGGAASADPAFLLGTHGQAGSGALLAQLWQHVRGANPLLDADPRCAAAGPAGAELRHVAAALLSSPDDEHGQRLVALLRHQALTAVQPQRGTDADSQLPQAVLLTLGSDVDVAALHDAGGAHDADASAQAVARFDAAAGHRQLGHSAMLGAPMGSAWAGRSVAQQIVLAQAMREHGGVGGSQKFADEEEALDEDEDDGSDEALEPGEIPRGREKHSRGRSRGHNWTRGGEDDDHDGLRDVEDDEDAVEDDGSFSMHARGVASLQSASNRRSGRHRPSSKALVAVETEAASSLPQASAAKRSKPAAAAQGAQGSAVLGPFLMVDFEQRPTSGDLQRALGRVDQSQTSNPLVSASAASTAGSAGTADTGGSHSPQ